MNSTPTISSSDSESSFGAMRSARAPIVEGPNSMSRSNAADLMLCISEDNNRVMGSSDCEKECLEYTELAQASSSI